MMKPNPQEKYISSMDEELIIISQENLLAHGF